jgi:hypothetical protein
MYGFRRAAAVLAGGTLTLQGCESHELTRPPDPALSPGDEITIGVAIGLAGVVWTVLLVAQLGRDRSPGLGRLLAGFVFAGAAVLVVGAVTVQVASDLKIAQLLQPGECREIPVEDRPHTILQLSCDGMTGTLSLVGLGYGVPVGLISLGLALDALRSRRPLVSTAVATLVAAILLWNAASPAPGDDPTVVRWSLLLAGPVAAAGVWELRRAVRPAGAA